MRVTVYHNPKCGTSRAVLQILHDEGVEPQIIEYLKTPLSRQELVALAKRLGNVADLLRTKEPLVKELNLNAADDETILDAISQHPILFNRPLVVTAKGAKLCRPAELVRTLI